MLIKLILEARKAARWIGCELNWLYRNTAEGDFKKDNNLHS